MVPCRSWHLPQHARTAGVPPSIGPAGPDLGTVPDHPPASPSPSPATPRLPRYRVGEAHPPSATLCPVIPATATAQIPLLASGALTSRALVEHALARIDQLEPTVRAFITRFDPEACLAAADTIDTARAAGRPLPPTAGIPIAIKDNIALAGHRLTCGSRMLEHYTSPYSATAAQRLLDAGLIVLGSTNLDEFAFGSSTEHSAFGPTTNPHDPARVPGGTSGGSAAAVAAGYVPWALGSDTGGSVRQPASFCGVVGLRPTYGRVSRYGLAAHASSMDVIGPLATSVADAALLLSIIEGHDPLDATSLVLPDVQPALPDAPAIGIPAQYLEPPCDPQIVAAVQRTAGLASSLGWRVQEVSLPLTRHALDVYYLIASVEAASNLGRYDGIRYGHRASGATSWADLIVASRTEALGDEAKRRIMLGTYAASAGYADQFYNRARRARRLIADEFTNAFTGADLLLTPVSPTTAWKLGDKSADPMQMYLADTLSVPAALAGVPSLAIPAGSDDDGLPIGIQLTAPRGSDRALLAAGRAIEAALAG